MKIKLLLFTMLLGGHASFSQSIYDFGKGDIFLKGSLPYVNSFHLQFWRFSKNNSGFAGMAGGMSYHFNKKYFLEGSAGAMGDLNVPLGATDRAEGEYENMFSAFTRITFNHTNGVFSFGYGLNGSLNGWARRWEGEAPPSFLEDDEIQTGVGPVLTGYYYLGPFYAGLQYHAQFAGGGDVYYSHIISLDFGLHLRIRKKSR